MCGKPLDCLVVSLWSRRFSLPPASLSSGSIVLHVHLGLSWNLSAFVPMFSKVDYGNRSCSSIAFACCLFEFSIWRTLGRLRRGTLYTFPYGIFTAHFRYQASLVFNAFVYIQRRWGRRRDSSPEVLQLGSGGDGARTQPLAPGPSSDLEYVLSTTGFSLARALWAGPRSAARVVISLLSPSLQEGRHTGAIVEWVLTYIGPEPKQGALHNYYI